MPLRTSIFFEIRATRVHAARKTTTGGICDAPGQVETAVCLPFAEGKSGLPPRRGICVTLVALFPLPLRERVEMSAANPGRGVRALALQIRAYPSPYPLPQGEGRTTATADATNLTQTPRRAI